MALKSLSSPKASLFGIIPRFGASVKERNPMLECHTCASAGVLHTGAFGYGDLSAGDRG